MRSRVQCETMFFSSLTLLTSSKQIGADGIGSVVDQWFPKHSFTAVGGGNSLPLVVAAG